MKVFAKKAYLQTGWARDITLSIKDGQITRLETGSRPEESVISVDTLLPALSNLHSHSFQRAMAGMTEFRAQGQENFWTWRELMYRFLDHLTPDQIGTIARFAFMEMQEAGFAAVAEFHYLHHAKGGRIYDDPAELSNQIMQAAVNTGIGLTHLPVLYSYGDVGQQPLIGGQQRFGHTVDQFQTLIERCTDMIKTLPDDTRIGIAPHSLRATSSADLAAITALNATGPIHMHIAEQVKEVVDVGKVLGARPVEWLLDNVDVNDRWCLIHATHMTADETQQVAKSGAVVGLCSVTEANLGDGVFNGLPYLDAGGRFGVGTDSNINISPIEELRMLEYSQRLTHRQRNVLATEDGSTGDRLYTAAALGGARALNRDTGTLEVGKLADMVAVNSDAPALCALRDDQILDGFLFAGNNRLVTDLWSAGRHCVRDGQHIAHDKIVAQYRQTMKALMETLD
jgi:formimidoylglutamate deiminase